MDELTWSLWFVFAMRVMTLISIVQGLLAGVKIDLKGIFILCVVIPAPFVLLAYLI